MAALFPTPDPQFIVARDGTRLAWRTIGAGPPVVLLHGLFSNASINWFRFGHAARLAAAGFSVIAPDLRCHGDSDAPHDPAVYRADVLVDDLADLVAALTLGNPPLVGFSLGARTVARAVVGGARPPRLVLAGMGLEGLSGWQRRSAFFLRALDTIDSARHGDDTWLAIQFIKSMKVDRVAARLLLGTFADTPPAALTALAMPTLVVAGDADNDNGSADALAAILPDATRASVPGTHMSSVTFAALGEAIAGFLTSA